MKKLLLNSFLAFCGFLIVGASNGQAILQESFEGGFPPTGWTLVNAGSGNQWSKNISALYAHDGSASMQYSYNSASAGNAWAFTPALQLNTNPVYISFYVSTRSGSFPENLKFTVGNSNTVAAQTTVLKDSAGLTNTNFRQWSATYTPSAAGNYNFAFNCYSLTDQWNLYVDSVTISQFQPPCTGTPSGGFSGVSTSYMCSPGNVTVSLSGASGGAGISYQFQSSPAGANTWSDIGPSGTTTTYMTSISASTDFRAKVTCSNGGGNANSAISTSTIGSVPANDDFCSAQALTLNAPYVCGNTTCATAVGDPAYSNSTANNTVWYTYTPSSNGPVQIRMKRPTGVTDGLVYAWAGIYTASGSCPTLTFSEVAGNALAYNLPITDSVNMLTTSLTAGTTYYIMIDGFSGSFGAYCLRLLTPPTPPSCVMNVSPVQNAVNRPIDDTLKWRKAPGTNITYDIYFGTTATPALALANFADTTIPVNGMAYSTTYNWYVVPKNDGSPATGCETNLTSFTTVGPPPAPANDDCINAIALSAYGGSINGTTISATQSQAPELCNGSTSGTAEDVWYKFTTLQNGNVTIALTNAGAALDAVIQAYSGTCGALTNIGCIDDGFSAGQNETIVLTGLTGGQTYYIRIYGWSSTSGQGNFTLTTTGTALPVRITQFTGVRNGNVNKLSWTTVSEVNNQGFELQRSADGKNYSMMQFVQTQAPEGNSSTPITYNYVDERPLAGSGFYRLKQVDKDGKFSYSNIVLIKGEKTDKLDMVNVYPNPAVDKLSVILVSPSNDKVSLIVTDLAGKMIINQAVQLISGDNNISVDVSKLSAGSYVIKTICSNGCESAVKKFVKQ